MTSNDEPQSPATTGDVVGYARVSTGYQDPGFQVEALTQAGAGRVFVDVGAPSRTSQRPQWIACLEYLRAGDTLLVWRLDRLAGTERLAIETIHDLHDRGVHIKSLTEPDIDTTTPMGRALFGIVAVFLQLRVDTIRENTRAGLDRARKNGRVGGRPTVMTPEKLRSAHVLLDQGHSLAHIARSLQVSRGAVTRAITKRQLS